ncbi:MAG: hypothetical protein DWQ07_23190 [Chloroflexi bacterium]|nr:MAG: hypothetical protein DWQ07_23190 [Chloroflexota bacterium]MBL1194055.1 hypothetical protein [Chloroflexota bacterium]NOH11349.1 hypothetical protein [Chloroflexota bacterium]
MKSLNYYQGLANEMVQADRGRDAMLRAMDDMWHNRWSLPKGISNLRWVHKVVSTDPHDALRAGTRVLSSVEPRIKLQPLAPNEATREKTDGIERALGWHFRNASRRRRANVLRDVVLSTLLYDEVVAQVVYLPEQIEAMKAFKGDTRRLEAARRYGPFSILVRNPRQVHVRYSDWMPESVLLKKVMRVGEVVDFWGTKARGLKNKLKEQGSKGVGGKKDWEYCTVYDYMDLDVRVVWAVPHAGGSMVSDPLGDAEGTGGVQILREKHDLGFLPWVAKVGGTTLEDEAAFQRMPLLASIYQSGQWDTQNIVDTLMASEVIAYAAAPRLKVSGPTDQVEVDYGEPGRPAYVPPGHELSAMTPPGLDQSLAVLAERIGSRMAKSTVPRVLQSGDFPSGTAFSTLNLATQSGIKSLAPYKELAEEALVDVFTQMLYWVKYANEPVLAFGKKRDDPGSQYTIYPKDIDLESVYMEVELTADVPTDRMARINAASMAVRDLNYSKSRALEQVGESDPGFIMEQAREETLDEVDLEIEKQRKLALGKLEIEKMVKEIQEGEEEAKAPEEAEVSEGPVAVAGQPQNIQELLKQPKFRERVHEVMGQGFNPAAGGSPPVQADPELSNRKKPATTKTGEEVAEV